MSSRNRLSCLFLFYPGRLLAALFCVVLLLGCAFAQDTAAVPQLVKFSGTISGAPAGTVGVIFALYKDQTGGAPLWQEVQNITVDANSHYNSLLGARSATGIPLELFSNGEARWLGVEPEGQPEQPRVLLVSVPYALKASDSETLGGLPASAFLRADATSVVAAPQSTTAPASYINTAAVNSAANRAVAAAIAASGATAGYLPVFTDPTGDLKNSALFQLNAGTTAAPVWNLGFGTVTPAFNLNFVSQVDPAAIAIDGYGAVGINFIGRRAEGTLAAPKAILNGDNIMAMQGRGYGATGFSTSSRAYMKFFAAENWTDAAQGTYISLATTPTGTAVAAERLRITAAGLVGIGTTAPAYPLSVNGVVQSLTGGFRFPDGTTQATAASGIALSSPDSSITVGGTGAAPTVAVNPSVIQKRVGSACSGGSAIASISSAGTVSCQTVSGGGAIGLPMNWSSTATAPAGVVNVTNTSNGPTMNTQSAPTESFFTSIPSAIVGTATGTGVPAGVTGTATNGVGVVGYSEGSQGMGVVGYTFNSNQPPLMAYSGLTGYVSNGNHTRPRALEADMVNGGGDVVEVYSSAAAASYLITGVNVKIDATSGNTEAFAANLSSPAAVGLGLYFNVPPTSGAMIQANAQNGANFSVDGNANVSISGNLHVNGTISKGGGSFKIDHPLDPANKYLYHSFVESPDMMNIYNGNIVTDRHGLATVELPSYFEALNQDFRYQLTVIGQFAQAIVVREIAKNHFTIKTSKPAVKVSWQVTGIRHDAYADAHRIQVEEDKGKERGTYLHPELFNSPQVIADKK